MIGDWIDTHTTSNARWLPWELNLDRHTHDLEYEVAAV